MYVAWRARIAEIGVITRGVDGQNAVEAINNEISGGIKGVVQAAAGGLNAGDGGTIGPLGISTGVWVGGAETSDDVTGSGCE